MPNLRDKLMRFFDWSSGRPFEWGQSDCVMEIATWLKLACGLDVAGPWRGKYKNEAEASAILDPLGGLEAAMRAEATRVGLEETLDPQFGDVALVTVPGQDKPLGAILMPSGRWRMKTMTRIVVTRDVIVIVAWKLPCRP